jgi:hypothetical protein
VAKRSVKLLAHLLSVKGEREVQSVPALGFFPFSRMESQSNDGVAEQALIFKLGPPRSEQTHLFRIFGVTMRASTLVRAHPVELYPDLCHQRMFGVLHLRLSDQSGFVVSQQQIATVNISGSEPLSENDSVFSRFTTVKNT